MKSYQTSIKHFVFAAGLMFAATIPVQAQGMPGLPEGGLRMEGPGFEARFEPVPGPAFLRGLKLTEEQEDKVFAIIHAQQPQLREQMKAMRKAREALQAMHFSVKYDDSKAKVLADVIARATADSILLRLRGEQQIYALLTAEQRKQLEDMKEKFRARAAHAHRHDPEQAATEQPVPQK